MSYFTSLEQKLRSRMGDFWFYSLLLFCSNRVADLLNAAVGLWLVPKFVSEQELGAVLPLSTFATMLALPAYIFAMTFMKEVNTLAVRGAYGQLKTLLRGVFIAVGIFLILAIILSRILMPLFLERIRIVEGSLGFLILMSAFLGCVAPIYTNALQALKKFKSLSLLSALLAPVRFLVMIVTMPFRALSGYFVGQGSTHFCAIFTSVFFLRKELMVPAEPYWTRPIIKRFSLLFLGMAGYQVFAMLPSLVEITILRQRLPDIDSGAYYMVTRFSDISGFLAGTLLTTLFPYTSELAENGRATRPFVLKAIIASLLFGGLLALFFTIFGKTILSLLPSGQLYVNYAWAIPWLIGIATLGHIQNFHTNTEVSARRFKFLWWWIPLSSLYPAMLFFVTGYGYFAKYLPKSLELFISKINITSLSSCLIWFTIAAALKCLFAMIELFHQQGNKLNT